MENTANLLLPYIMPSQAQKHVTHNEALVLLDAFVHLTVLSRDTTEPPVEAADGERYIVPSTASGAWDGWTDSIALHLDGGWRKIEPQTGFFAWIADEDSFAVWDGEAWTDLGDAVPRLQNLERLGLGTAADVVNPFAAKLNKALWTARYVDEGGDGDLRYTLNKEAPAGTLSLLLQSDWSGRAEIGLIGDDDLAFKVSPDGVDWKDALRIDRGSGTVGFPHTQALNALASLAGANGAFPRFTGPDSATMQSIVGPVSQASGIPTGAIIEKATNANGSYVRFADGTQFCRHRMTPTVAIDIAFGGGFRCEPQSWTFPIGFAAGSLDDIHVQASAGAVSHSVQAVATSETTAAWYHMQPGSASASQRPATLMAFGRWF